MRIAFDSRATKDHRGVGRYARCLLEALHRHGHADTVETHDPRLCDVYHSPWLEGSLLRARRRDGRAGAAGQSHRGRP